MPCKIVARCRYDNLTKAQNLGLVEYSRWSIKYFHVLTRAIIKDNDGKNQAENIVR